MRADFDLQGHRGARGLLPENSIPGFRLAVDLGVDTVEMDVVVSADSQVVVSHDPWMSDVICAHPDGRPVAREEASSLLLYSMTYDEIARYDCGSRGHPGFPDQRPAAAAKPLLRTAIRAIRGHSERDVRFNIEIKSSPEGDGVRHPPADEFALLLYNVLSQADELDHTTVQSFDPRALEAFRRLDPASSLSLLVSNADGLEANLGRLGFLPGVYSPEHGLVDGHLVDAVHELGMTIIPWTVNEPARMLELLLMGVDGIITDYPDRGARLKS